MNVGGKLAVAVVTNIPAPYRLPVYTLLAQEPDIDLHVVFSSGREPDREWNLSAMGFTHSYLKERFLTFRGRFIHVNHDIWAVLNRLKPDVVITTGFNPTHIIAHAWARIHAATHVPMTDGTLESEAALSSVHRWIRHRIYSRSTAWIAASEGGMQLYRSYGIDNQAMFKSHLCADNNLFLRAPPQEKRFDFIFCGRFVASKNPFFALEVARDVAVKLGRRVSMVFVGSGQLDKEIRIFAKTLEAQVETEFAGFAKQEALPHWYGSSRVLLFPTGGDTWGVVANEACAAGVPVLISPEAGAAGELIRNGESGYVLRLEKSVWVEAAAKLLSDGDLYDSMSRRAREMVSEYSFENAAKGIAMAARVADRASPAWSRHKSRIRPRVVIIQARLTRYRVPLFELMRDMLDAAGIELMVLYGDPTRSEQLKSDSGELAWGVHVPTRYFFNDRLCWQNALPYVQNADLVVITQENRLIFNYFLAILRGKMKWAFWGHGRNFQARIAHSFSENFKRWLASRVDWWFAYTSLSRAAVLASGFPEAKVTLLNNAVDTSNLRRLLDSLSPDEVGRSRNNFGIGPGRVGLYLGSLYAEKRLDLVLAAARRIREQVPDFQLVIVGDGPQRDMVARAVAESGGGVHWLGARSGRDKAILLSMAEVLINPGAIGLVVLDAFIAQVPLVTMKNQLHGPEIAYLESGRNGIVAEDNVDAFASAVVRLLADPVLLNTLKAGCRQAAEEFTLENMASNFCDGIAACLARSPKIPPANGGKETGSLGTDRP